MAKVLLVEDDNNLREIYEARLQAEGYEIAAAQDGEQALVVAKDFKPDLVISDVMMPKISGFEMLDILRNTEGLKNTRVIMLTALSQAEDKSRADSLGADRYLVKSQVTLEDIIKAAHDILGDGEAPASAPSSSPAPAEATTMEPVAAPAPEPAAAPDLAVAAPPADVATPAPETTPTPAAEAPQPQAAPATAEEAIAQAVEAETPTTPVTPATPITNPISSAEEQKTAHDDKLLADAAHSLNDSTGAAAEPPATDASTVTPTPVSPSLTPTDNATATEDDSSTGASAGSSKRVIQPISDNDSTKPTLEELLAREEAKEITTASPAPTVSEAPTTPTADVTPPPAKPKEFNPHDISL